LAFQLLLLVCTGIFHSHFPLAAQELAYKQFPNNDVLVNTTPLSMVEDSTGLLLVLTNKGLVQFNGQRFVRVTYSPSFQTLTQTRTGKLMGLGTDGIYQMACTSDTVIFRKVLACPQPLTFFEDLKGGWWIQLHSGQLLYYFNGRTRIFTLPVKVDSLFFWHDLQKGIFVITSTGQILHPVPNHSLLTPVGHLTTVHGNSPPTLKIKKLIHKSDREFWLLTSGSLFQVHVPKTNSNAFAINPVPIPTTEITDIFQNNESYLYLATHTQGLLRADLSHTPYAFVPVLINTPTSELEPLNDTTVHSLYSGVYSSIWLLSREKVAQLYPKAFFDPYPVLLSYEIGSMAQTQEGTYYFSAVNEILKADASLYPARIVSIAQLTDGSISTIAAERNRIWIGGSIGQLSYLQKDKWHPGLNLSKRGGPIFNIYSDSKHRVWFCQVFREKPLPGVSFTDSTLTLHYFGPEQGLPGRIISVKESPQGTLFFGGIGTESYLYRYQEATGRFENLSIPLPFDVSHFEVHDLSIDRQGIIWLASSNGLLKYDPRKKKITRIDLGPYITPTEMRAIGIDRNGQVWVATDSYGLISYNKNGFVRYTLLNGLPTPGNVLWYRRLLIDNQNRIWTGSNTSVVSSVDSAPQAFPTRTPVLTSLQINGQTLHPYVLESLPYHAQLEARYISLSYPTGNIEYQTQLVGFENEWSSPTTGQSVSYSQLPTGTYTLQIRARQNGYHWSKPARFTFTVAQVWYLQWWAYVLYAFLLLSLLQGFAKIRTWRHTQENKRLNKIIEAKVQELREAHQEVVAQNEELLSQQEEISGQHDQISQQYEQLQQAQQTIARQNEIIRKKNKNLEKQVHARTRELVEYNQQLEQFAFITAHNLRSPVARIQGLGLLLELSEKDTSINSPDITKKLVKTAYDLDQVIKDLNAILEVKKNNTQVLIQINLYDELEKVKANLSKEIEETHTYLEVDIAQVYEFSSIPAYIDSILYNLISNAIKYRRPDLAPHIVLKTSMHDQTICIEVSDNGLGIDLSMYGHSVYQLYKRFHFHVEGKGLGLYLVKTQVDALGGQIELESQVNQGTTFRIYLSPGQKHKKRPKA
jgi:signal transduction histidine kinase/ligand-binding sensor domain-containing protein